MESTWRRQCVTSCQTAFLPDNGVFCVLQVLHVLFYYVLQVVHVLGLLSHVVNVLHVVPVCLNVLHPTMSNCSPTLQSGVPCV